MSGSLPIISRTGSKRPTLNSEGLKNGKTRAAVYTYQTFHQDLISPVTLSLNRLNCVLRATDAAHADAVTSWLRVSTRVGEIATCRTDTELRTELADRTPATLPDFVVLVVSHAELPPYLLRYPDLRVLVLTTHRKVGSLTPWLQQGASDVASFARPHQAQHALGRMIDESAMERRVSLLATELLRSEMRFATLVKNSRAALSFWRDDELLSCSAAFSDITGLSEGASTTEWLGLLDPKAKAELGDKLEDFPDNARASVLAHGRTIRIAREQSCEASDDNEQLISVKLVMGSTIDTVSQSPILPKTAPNAAAKAAHKSTHKPSLEAITQAVVQSVEADATRPSDTGKLPTLKRVVGRGANFAPTADTTDTDSVSGLPERQAVVQNFQQWLLQASENSRYVAMTVDLSETVLIDDTKSNTVKNHAAGAAHSAMACAVTSHVDRTLQDLAVYRAADRLSETLNSKTLLGRLSNDRLLIIRELEANEAPRMLAKGIRRSLGSLGGLLGSPDLVRINTVNISARRGASAETLVTRLENR